MARKRYISNEMGKDQAIKALAKDAGEFAVLLYTWLIPAAEDDGIVKGDAESILVTVFPLWRWLEPERVDEALKSIARHGLIEWDGAKVVFPYDKFYAYQKYIKQSNRRQVAESCGNLRKTAENTVPPPPPPSHTHTLPPPRIDAAVGRLAFLAGTTNEANQLALNEYLEWGITEEVVAHAIGIMRRKGNTFSYLDGILKRYRRQGIKTMSDVERDEDSKGGNAQSQPAVKDPSRRKADDVLREQGII